MPSTQEKAEIEAHNTELKQLRSLHNERYNKRVQLESSKNKLDNFLSKNLFLKRDDLEQSLKQLLPAKSIVTVSTLKKELIKCNEEADKHKKELDEIETKMKQFSEKVTMLYLPTDKFTSIENMFLKYYPAESVSFFRIYLISF